MRTLTPCTFKQCYTHIIRANTVLQVLHAVGDFRSLILTPENEFAGLECYKYVTLRSSLHVTAYSLVYPLYMVAEHLINLLKPTGDVTHQQFNIQQLYALPTLYLCVLYLSEKKTATCAT